MIGRKQEINLQIQQILDSGVVALSFWFSHLLRHSLTQAPLGENRGIWFLPKWLPEEIPAFSNFFWLMAIIVPFTPIILEMHGYYEHPLQKTVWRSIRQLGQSLFWLGVIVGACVIFFQWHAQSRAVLMIFIFVGGAALLAKEALVRKYLRKRAQREGIRERILVAGVPEDVDSFVRSIPEGMLMEMEVVDRIDLATQSIDDLVDSLHDNSIERVVFCAGHVHFGKVQEAISACETEGVEAWLSANFIQTSIAQPTFDVMAGRLMMVFRSTPEISWALFLKDTMDRLGALILIVLTFPLWIIAWIGIKLSSPGPVIFRQQRGGKHGKPFTMLKFRTMGNDAEQLREELTGANEMDGPVFKIDKDPRIFRFGTFLRKWSIDEFPQLINVMLGQMSLVGPRPLPVYEVEKFEHSSQRRRLSMKPGLTCLWQISGRNRITSFEDWVKLDLEYIDNWSIWLDFKILVRTVPAVLFGSGAS